jgi:hypothetical protein
MVMVSWIEKSCWLSRVKCHHLHLRKNEDSKGDRVGQRVGRQEDQAVDHRKDLNKDRQKEDPVKEDPVKEDPEKDVVLGLATVGHRGSQFSQIECSIMLLNLMLIRMAN